MGVGREGFAWADAEELWVEVCGVVEESAVAGVAGARVVGIGVVEALQIPAPVGGEAPDGIDAVGDQLPQVLGGPDTPRIATAHPHNHDRVVLPGLELVQALPGLLQVGRDPLEIGPELVLDLR